jgi:hypothetical protein
MPAWGLVCSGLESLELCLYWGCASTDWWSFYLVLACLGLGTRPFSADYGLSRRYGSAFRSVFGSAILLFFSSSFAFDLLGSSCPTFFAMTLAQPIS